MDSQFVPDKSLSKVRTCLQTGAEIKFNLNKMLSGSTFEFVDECFSVIIHTKSTKRYWTVVLFEVDI